MTFQPPPPPPPGGTPPPPPPPPGGGQPYGSQPGQPVPPPAQQWGAPPPSGGAGFDPKAVNPLDWAIIAVGVLAFIFSTFDYYKVTVSLSGFGSRSATASAWHGFFGWFAALLALVGAALVALAVFQPNIKLPIATRFAALIAFAVASLCVILAIFIIPGASGGNFGGVKVDKGHGFAFWIDLLLILGGTVLCLMRAQQTGTALPGALGKMPHIGGGPARP